MVPVEVRMVDTVVGPICFCYVEKEVDVVVCRFVYLSVFNDTINLHYPVDEVTIKHRELLTQRHGIIAQNT